MESMKFVVMREIKNGDIETEEFNDRKKAIAHAVDMWDYLTKREKAACKVYVIESVNPDETADNHLDGNPIYTV